MKRIATQIGIVLLAFLLLCCERESPCSRLVNGVYHYPTLPDDHHYSQEQIHEYLDIPRDIRTCISTDGLIESCLTYPEIRLIYAGSSPQTGYNLVFSMYSGLSELERRPDASDQLLAKYESLNPLNVTSFDEEIEQGRYAFSLNNIEILISQYTYLEKLAVQQKKALVSRARAVYLLKKEKDYYYGVFGLAFTTAVLSRLMKLDRYPPFMEIYDPSQLNWDVVEHYWSTNFETTEKIYALSESYLDFLHAGK